MYLITLLLCTETKVKDALKQLRFYHKDVCEGTPKLKAFPVTVNYIRSSTCIPGLSWFVYFLVYLSCERDMTSTESGQIQITSMHSRTVSRVLRGGGALKQTPPENRMTDRCKNITFATSLRTVNISSWCNRATECKIWEFRRCAILYLQWSFIRWPAPLYVCGLI